MITAYTIFSLAAIIIYTLHEYTKRTCPARAALLDQLNKIRGPQPANVPGTGSTNRPRARHLQTRPRAGQRTNLINPSLVPGTLDPPTLTVKGFAPCNPMNALSSRLS